MFFVQGSKSYYMKKYFLSIILKIRDRLWFYVHQQYPNDPPESHEPDFRMRFGAITLTPPNILIYTADAICRRFFDFEIISTSNITKTIQTLVIFFISWWYFNKYVLSVLSVYPINKNNDLGKVRNVLYVASFALFFLFLLIGYMILFNAIWPRN